jgi:hypothetical protein
MIIDPVQKQLTKFVDQRLHFGDQVASIAFRVCCYFEKCFDVLVFASRSTWGILFSPLSSVLLRRHRWLLSSETGLIIIFEEVRHLHIYAPLEIFALICVCRRCERWSVSLHVMA